MVESTAAALSYGLHVAGRKTVMVFDMGGGTTDITIMLINDGRTELLGVHGDNSCGGRDLDYQLLDHVLTRLYTSKSKERRKHSFKSKSLPL
jgi:molecular chaperone DnaK (HSP70)